MKSEKVTAWVRTTVPGLWAALLVYLVSLGTPDWAMSVINAVPDEFVVTAALALVYALLRWAEPHMPAFLKKILLGSVKEPSYN